MSKDQQPKKSTNPCRTVTGEVRFSFVNVFNPRGRMDDNGKEIADSPKFYSVCVLVDKKDKKTIDRINHIIDEAIKNGESILKSKATGKVNKASLDISFRDGDESKADERPEFKDKMYFNCKTKMRPKVLDADYNEIIDPSEFKSGDYGKASITAYPYSQNGNKGVAFNLNGLMKLEDGEPLNTGVAVEDEFMAYAEEDDDDDDIL